MAKGVTTSNTIEDKLATTIGRTGYSHGEILSQSPIETTTCAHQSLQLTLQGQATYNPVKSPLPFTPITLHAE